MLKIKKLFIHIATDLCLIAVFSLVFLENAANTADLAFAEDLDVTYPYTHTFTITAYYSPLVCQERYVTGSYEGDIRLNGGGVHGADGTDVYPGMIAAPKTYQFGTKMDIPGVGIVSVHDRGGAIVAGDGENGTYDRLDIWMGYGDIGLKRALDWGKRTLEVTVYGINDSIVEQITLSDYSSDEAIPNDCSIVLAENTEEATEPEPQENNEYVEPENNNIPQTTEKFQINLEYGNSGNGVSELQVELKNINYYKSEITGIYDDLTEHAVFKFQQAKEIVVGESDSGAGVFGPKTREELNKIVQNREYTLNLISKTTAMATSETTSPDFAFSDESDEKLLTKELSLGVSDTEVTILQNFLKEKGYFGSPFITDYFGEVTREALIQFQLDNGLITDESAFDAGELSGETLETINTMAI